jgi:hypothetical protein
MKKEIGVIVFWGALWGLFEGTVGYILHMLPINLGWFVWFPAAYFFMVQVYKQTGKANSIFYTSIIAAAIKLVDFLLPVRVDMVLNPFASIILEGLVVFAVYRMLEQQEESMLRHEYVKVLVMSISWRVLYLLYLLPLPEFIVKISPLRGVEPFVKFLFMEGMVNSVIIYACIIITKRLKENGDRNRQKMTSDFDPLLSRISERISLRPTFSFVLLLFAVFVEWTMKALW